MSRQQGVVAVRLADELRGEAAVTDGLLQLDATELPEPLRSTPWDFAYRAAAMPFSLVLTVEAVQPRIEARINDAHGALAKDTLDVVAPKALYFRSGCRHCLQVSWSPYQSGRKSELPLCLARKKNAPPRQAL